MCSRFSFLLCDFQLSFGFLNAHSIACWRLRRHFRRSTSFAEHDLGGEISELPFNPERIVFETGVEFSLKELVWLTAYS